jgi:hypothetical protein
MLIEQVDAVGPQPLQRSLDDIADMLGPAVEPDHRAVRIELEAELGGDDHLIPNGFERLANEHFVGERPVALGGVKERDSTLVGGADHGDPVALVGGWPQPEAQAHAAEAERRNGEAAEAQLTRLHGGVSLR